MICLILIWFFYGLSRMFQLPQFVWALRSSVWDVFINFLLIDATDRIKISSDQKRFFIALSLHPLSFFANTPFNKMHICSAKEEKEEEDNSQAQDNLSKEETEEECKRWSQFCYAKARIKSLLVGEVTISLKDTKTTCLTDEFKQTLR